MNGTHTRSRYGAQELRDAFVERLSTPTERATFRIERSQRRDAFIVALLDQQRHIEDGRLQAVSEAPDDVLFFDLVEFELGMLRRGRATESDTYSRVRHEAELYSALYEILVSIFGEEAMATYLQAVISQLPEPVPESPRDWESRHYVMMTEEMKSSIVSCLKGESA